MIQHEGIITKMYCAYCIYYVCMGVLCILGQFACVLLILPLSFLQEIFFFGRGGEGGL